MCTKMPRIQKIYITKNVLSETNVHKSATSAEKYITKNLWSETNVQMGATSAKKEWKKCAL